MYFNKAESNWGIRSWNNMMSRGNQEYVEELLNYGFSPKVIHKHTGLCLQQIYQIQEDMYKKKTLQKEINNKEVGK